MGRLADLLTKLHLRRDRDRGRDPKAQRKAIDRWENEGGPTAPEDDSEQGK